MPLKVARRAIWTLLLSYRSSRRPKAILPRGSQREWLVVLLHPAGTREGPALPLRRYTSVPCRNSAYLSFTLLLLMRILIDKPFTCSGTSPASRTIRASASRRRLPSASVPGVGRATPSTTARSPTPSGYPVKVRGAYSACTTQTGTARSSSSSLAEKSRPGYGSRPTGRSWKVTGTTDS